MLHNNILSYISGYLKRNNIWILLLIILAFLIHYFIFLNYFVDDAFITFACAKTLAEYGRFSIDRFAEIVEASSTPLWTLILACIHFLGVPAPIAAKVLNCFFSISTIVMVFLIGSKYGAKGSGIEPYYNHVGPFLLAFITGFVLWSASGLENALYGFLVVGLIYGALICNNTIGIVVLTIFSSLISIVRPEGLIFFIAIYVTIILKSYLNSNGINKKLITSLVGVILFYVLFLYAKYSIFSWIFPNTYYAKIVSLNYMNTIANPKIVNFLSGGLYISEFFINYWPLILLNCVFLVIIFFHNSNSTKTIKKSLARLISSSLILLIGSVLVFNLFYLYPKLFYALAISSSAPVIFYILNIFLLCISLIFVIHLVKFDREFIIVPYNGISINVLFKNELVLYSASIFAINLLFVLYVGYTWGDTRFLTPAVIALAILSQELIKLSYITSPDPLSIRKIIVQRNVVIIIILTLFVIQMGYNTYNAYKSPIVPADEIKERNANFGNTLGCYLIFNEYLPNAKHVKYLVPDIGATAYYADNYTTVDLAMLGSVPLAHNKYERNFFKQYIFDTIKPTIIETHTCWSLNSYMGSYEEFSNSYELIKGEGMLIYRGKAVPNGHYIRKDLFISEDNSPIKISNGYLGIANYTINTKLFSPLGEMVLSIYWKKSSNITVSEDILDNHSLKLILKSPEGEFVIDEHPIVGGYYAPSKWNSTSEILDKHVISLNIKNNTEGHYVLEAQVIYPNGQTDSTTICHIHIVPINNFNRTIYIDTFYNKIDMYNFNDAMDSLNEIRGFDLELYNALMDTYIDRKLNYIDSLIAANKSDEAYNEFYALAGNFYTNNSMNNHLKRTESSLAILLDNNGNKFEGDGMIPESIEFYEKAIWLNPDNSKLRKHIEEIRQRQDESRSEDQNRTRIVTIMSDSL